MQELRAHAMSAINRDLLLPKQQHSLHPPPAKAQDMASSPTTPAPATNTSWRTSSWARLQLP
eukprot:7853975-Lingulodinium_polyedra.AAC.1